MDELTAMEEWASALLARLQPAEQRKVAMDVGRELRRTQKARIAAQRNPDGSAYAARKPRTVMRIAALRDKPGRIKRRAMFAKLRTARFLKVQIDGQGLAIGFAGRAARMARVHQDGLASDVAAGRSYTYPVRQLLGFTDAERDMIREKLMAHLLP